MTQIIRLEIGVGSTGQFVFIWEQQIKDNFPNSNIFQGLPAKSFKFWIFARKMTSGIQTFCNAIC